MPNIEPEQKSGPLADVAGKVVHVCVAVILRNAKDTETTQVLIAKRPEHVHQGGLWEFPGGKVEAGETISQALDRELDEELGIRLPFGLSDGQTDTQCLSPLIQIQHAYSDKTVLLDVWKIHRYQGQAHGKEGQEVRWVPLHAITDYSFPEANLPIMAACLLPNRYFITPSYASVLEAEQDLQCALELGAQLIYFRQPQLDSETYASWMRILVSRKPVLSQVLMGQQMPAAEAEICAGVHLSFRSASLLKMRPVPQQKWFAVSCHNEEELRQAKQIGADFVTLSPVLPTKTHPEAQAMGWSCFKALVRRASLPVFGLGGLSDDHLSRLQESGAQGLAGIRFWQ